MKPHRTDRISLLFGLAFLAAAGLWLAARLIPLTPAAVGAAVAGGLVLLGMVGLVFAISSSRRNHHSGKPR